MRHLFDINDLGTVEAMGLSKRIHEAIASIIRDAARDGVSLRDVELIALYEVQMICAMERIALVIKQKKKKKTV